MQGSGRVDIPCLYPRLQGGIDLKGNKETVAALQLHGIAGERLVPAAGGNTF